MITLSAMTALLSLTQRMEQLLAAWALRTFRSLGSRSAATGAPLGPAADEARRAGGNRGVASHGSAACITNETQPPMSVTVNEPNSPPRISCDQQCLV